MTRPPFVHEWFAETAAAHGSMPAIDAGARAVTYGDLDRRTNGLARAIAATAPRGTLIGILTDDVVDIVAAVIAVLKAGCAFVPMEPSSGDARFETLVDEIDLTWWIADPSQLDRLARLGRTRGRTSHVFCLDAAPTPQAADGAEVIPVDVDADTSPFAVSREPDELCYVYFTSGSTGRPKGIAGRLKAIDHFVRWEAQTIGAAPGIRVSQLTSPVFDAFLRDIFLPLCHGGVVCVPSAKETKLDAFGLAAWLREMRVNVIHAVPSVLRTLLHLPVGECRLPDLTHALTSGEPLLPADAQRWMARFGAHARLTNLYGPSETTMVKFAYGVTAKDAEARFISIGKPIDGTRAIVVNEHGKVCPPGSVGEIYIRTPYRSLGYLGRPELTAAAFIRNPFAAAPDPNDLVYRTGDLGRVLEDGNYEFLGRRDFQVKIRGVRVELPEIENALRRDARVRDVAVIDRELGDGSKTLFAFVVLQDGLTVDELKRQTGDVLPDYMLPSTFIVVDALPRTATGKVERQALEALIPTERRTAGAIAEPRTPVEELVASVWARALGVERVDINDNFFQDLGGHSLLATQVLARLQPLFEVGLKLRWLFEAPTIAGFSASIEEEIRQAAGGGGVEPPLERISREQPLPTSFGQERLWVVDQVTGTRAYHLPLAVKLQGDVDECALAAAVRGLAARHEILRTTFGVVDGRPIQRIAPAPAADTRSLPPIPSLPILSLPIVDLRAVVSSGSGGTRRMRPVQYVLHALEAARFDLAQGPLWRAALLRVDAETSIFACTLHHIITDGWSMGVLVRDLAALYEAARTGDDPLLPALTLQYADYAAWQRRTLAGERVASELAYWRTQLAGVAPLALPTDRPRGAVPTGRGGAAWRQWTPEQAGTLHAWAREHGATPFMVLAAAWQALLARYAGQRDIAVGVPIAQRPRPELEPLIGFFLNTLVLRTNVDSSASWEALVARVRTHALEAYAHQTVPFEQVIDALQPERDLARTPLFQVLFVLHNTPEGGVQLPAVRLETIDPEGGSAKFDLELGVRTNRDGLTARLEYASDLFDRATIDRMLAHLETLVASALADPSRALADLPMLSAAERQQMLTTWNATDRAWTDPASASLVTWLEAQARHVPDALAVWAAEGAGDTPEALWTYAELHAHANQIARRLRTLGVGAESRVGVWLSRSRLYAAALLGVLKAGAAYVPLDPSYPAARLAFQVVDARVAVVLTDRASAADVPTGPHAIEMLDAEDAAWRLESSDPLDAAIDPDQLAYIIYTSGSTGQPKGAMNSHRAIVNRLLWMQAQYRLTRADRVLQKTSCSFDVSVWELFLPLGAGAAMVLAKPGGQQDPDYLADVIARAGVTVTHFVPAMLEAFVSSGGMTACERLRLIVCSGEALPAPLVRRTLTAWPNRQATRRLENLYGPTEAAVDVTWYACTQDRVTDAAVVPIGRPVANTRMYALDPAGQPTPIGVVGEIHIGGVQVGRGYWDRPDLTADRFIPDAFGAPGARLYRTGDLGRYRADGVLEYVGRIDQQVKLRGNRIELGEIEAALREHAGARDAAVLLREDTPGDRRLVAYVVAAADGRHAASDAVQQMLRAHLPDYMVPALFVFLDALPLTPNGKVDRRRLPAPAGDRPVLGQQYIAPRSSVEATLARCWAEVLRVDRVGIHDNFFSLGGDSILALQVLARAQEHGIRLTPRQLFQHQTIADLALVATQTKDEQVAGPDIAAGDVPLTPIQRWFFELETAHPHHFNQSILLAGGPELPHAGWQALVDALLRQHDSLRLRFMREDDGWRERYADSDDRRVFMEVDLRGLGARWPRVLQRLSSRTQASLNLDDGPLIRVVSFRGATHADDRILIVIHHAVIDGVSWRVLLEDLHRAAAQWRQGNPIVLPAKSASFRRWAEHLAGAAATLDPAERAYWETANERMKATPLPRDVRGPNTIGSQRLIGATLTKTETQAFLQQPPRAYRMQAHEVLIAAVAEAMAAWTGSPDAVIALEGHGREALEEAIDVSRTVGCFTSLFPVRLSVSPDGPGATLRSIKEELRRVPSRGLSYGLWRHGAARDEAHATPEVLVNYLGQFDQVLDDAGWQLARESMGRSRHPSSSRAFLLDISGGVAEGVLHVSVAYSPNLHRAETVQRFADDLLARLRALVAHCREVEWTQTTPSDVLLAQVTQGELDAFAAIGGEIDDVYPLSPMQEGLLFHALFEPESAVYFQQFRVRLVGDDLRPAAFKRAWADEMTRHPVLRTAFMWEQRARALQVAYAHVPPAFDVLDLSAYDEDERTRRLTDAADADRGRGFRLDRVPLMRLSLIKLGAREWEFIWSYHHILLDGWCVPIVFKEIALLYEAHRAGRAADLPPVGRFRDYIAWLRRQDSTRAEAYWRGVLHGFREPTPFLPPRGLLSDGAATGDALAPEYGRRERLLGDVVASALQSLARRHHLTPNTIVQGAWAVLLSRYSHTRDIVFGATSSGRPTELPGIESMVGLFINTLPVRADVDPRARVAPWLRALQDAQAEGREYEYTPLVDIQGWSDVPGGLPLFESLLAFENYPVDEALVEGEASFEFAHAQVFEKTNYPVTVQVAPAPRLTMRILFDGRRVEAAMVERMLGHLGIVLTAILNADEARLGELPLLSAVERAQMLGEWSTIGGAWSMPASGTLLERVERQVTLTPDAPAVSCEGDVLSYAELHARANRLANVLRAEGVGPEVPVAVCLERGISLIVALLGIWKAGGAYVPLDTRYPTERLTYMVTDVQAPVLVTEAALADHIPLPELRRIVLDRDTDRLNAASPVAPAAGVDARNLAYVIFTSGSTGRSKGVAVTHGNVASLFHGTDALFGFGPHDTWTLFHSYGFDFSVWEMWGALAYGGRLLVVPYVMARTPEAFYELVRREGVTVLNQTPSAFRAFMAVDDAQRAELKLRAVIFGGEALDPGSLRGWVQRRGVERPQLVNMYGITETTVHVTYHPLSAREIASGTASRIGRALPSLRLYVLDAAGEPAPIGVSGELFVGGGGVARGYVGRPELTTQRFPPDPFGEPGSRLYRTGDLARWHADGILEYVGRSDQQVKVRGYRIEPGEIEHALAQHASVRDALVIVREDTPGERRLVAYVVPRANTPDADAPADVTTAVGAELAPATVPAPVEGESRRQERVGVADSDSDVDGDAESDAGNWEHRQVTQWEAVFEQNYAPGTREIDPTFNISGWNSSYTGGAIPDHEMREWVDETVADILALRPTRVLEIGCGTGLLLFRVAPRCERYCGTDLSRTALDHIERQLAALDLPTRIELRHRAADDFSDIETAAIADNGFDVVVINSVAQYFPSAEYLARVIERASRLVSPGGAIYVGDVRSLPLLRTFHGSVQLLQAPGWLQKGAFERRLDLQLHQEEELILSPEFFLGLKDTIPAIAGVDIRPKRGLALNELTKFRYQAVLHVGPIAQPPLEPAWRDWTQDRLSLDAVRALLRGMRQDERPAAVGIAHVPNARLQEDLRLLAALAAVEEDAVMDELRAADSQQGANAGQQTGAAVEAVHPRALLALAAEEDCDATLDWSRHDATGSFDVVFIPRGTPGRWPGWSREIAARESGSLGANSPLLAQAGRRLAPVLRRFLEERLPSHMVPAAFVVIDRFPMTPNGKVDRRALPPPDFARPELEQAYVAPRTPLEERLAEVWADVLRVQQVGIHDNFFELGGDSIISIQLVARANQAGIALTPKLLFERPTIAQIAEHSAAAADATDDAAPPDDQAGEAAQTAADGAEAHPVEHKTVSANGNGHRAHGAIDVALAGVSRDDLQRALKGGRHIEDYYPLSPMQEGMLFHSVYAPDSGVYVAQMRYTLAGNLDPVALRQAWRHAIARHSALRTGFLWDRASVPIQVVCREADLSWDEHDWRAIPEADQRTRMDALLEADRARGFDLAEPPLMRVALIRTRDDVWELIWSHHHLLLDGWSLPIVSQEVIRGYTTFRHGDAPQLDAAVPYRSYIAWLTERESVQAERFWRGTLEGFGGATPFPLTPPRPGRDALRPQQRHLELRLSARKTAALKAWTRKRHLTLNTLVQALWALVVRRLSGSADVVFGGVVSGRPPSLPGSDRCIGLFINTLPIRIQVPGDGDLVAWLGAVQAQQAEQREYEFVPLVRIRNWSDVPAGAPLFETLLVFENYPIEPASWGEGHGLRVDGLSYHMTESHPFVLAVGPGPQLNLNIKYDRARIEPSRVQQIHAMLDAALDLLAKGQAARVADLAHAIEGAERRQQAEDQVRTQKTAAELLQTVKRAAGRRRASKETEHGSGT